MYKFLIPIKQYLLPRGRVLRKIIAGPLKGIVMLIDFSYNTQLYLGIFEKELHKWLSKLSQDINTAIDMGGGEGEYTLYPVRKPPPFMAGMK